MSVRPPGLGNTSPRQEGNSDVDSLTFDVTGAAKLCFNYLNRLVDPVTGFTYMWTYLLTDPPKASHQGWDLVEESGRALEALVPLRLMTGEDTGLDRELWLRDKLIELLDTRDGLIYRPQTAYSHHVADVYDQSSALLGLVMRYLAEMDAVMAKKINYRRKKGFRWQYLDYLRPGGA